MNLLLIAPRWLNVYGSFKFITKLLHFEPPLGLCYLASSCEKEGIRTDILDCEAEEIEIEDILKYIRQKNPDFIGITTTTPTIGEAKKIAKAIKENFKIPIIVGGPHVTLVGKQVLDENPEFDFALTNDCETRFPAFLKLLWDGKKIEDIEGLIFRKNGETQYTRPPKEDIEFDRIPFPAREKLNIRKYKWFVPGIGEKIATTFQTSRGCPLRCIFCSERVLYPKVKLRSPQNIIDELKHIKKNHPEIEHIIFIDDTITLVPKRAFEIFKLMEEERLGFTFECETVANRIDEKLAEQMVRAGLKRINFGIESGDPQILKMVQKGTTKEDIKRAYKIVKRLGVETRGSVIIGLPYENIKTITRTILFIYSLKELDFAYINIATPYPGTALRDMVLEGKGGAKLYYSGYDMKRYGAAVIGVGNLKPSHLVLIQKIAVILFYSRVRRIINIIRSRGIKFSLQLIFGFIFGNILDISNKFRGFKLVGLKKQENKNRSN